MTSMRIRNETISMSNIKAAIETFLRQTKVINDSEDVKLLTFGTVADQTTVTAWEAMQVVPIQIVLKSEEVELIIHK